MELRVFFFAAQVTQRLTSATIEKIFVATLRRAPVAQAVLSQFL
jgi:hypothetical protein